ncbi:MAG: Maf-like protein [Alphaproteobacteria bacterium]|nr:MAG: Maf-like protein [Alphaproteobacteria bacterium]
MEKKGQNRKKKWLDKKKQEKYTKLSKVILASSSEVRKKMLNKYFSTVINVPHKADEEKYKKQKKNPEEIVLRIAKEKALSVLENYPNEIIIASDQILVCENKVLSKPKSLEEATKKLLFLRNKTHKLYSSIYVIQKGKFYFQQVKEASLFFANISQNDIELYVKNNKKTVLTTVGSYKIEENSKYKFLSIIDGDLETILGFPIKDLIKKIKHEK